MRTFRASLLVVLSIFAYISFYFLYRLRPAAQGQLKHGWLKMSVSQGTAAQTEDILYYVQTRQGTPFNPEQAKGLQAINAWGFLIDHHEFWSRMLHAAAVNSSLK